ncbi:LamG-like jellyroll fold domain-containing protein [Catenulispora pinisilvae]|uniref:LamG-like jellyroll fold domain-containing protein n=1 Tax=Catenulispora pinisilvae TaxID=2705253 RepID=UPI0018920288|nr:LamG domain-containing protein [Catenulispora pinisilvae]
MARAATAAAPADPTAAAIATAKASGQAVTVDALTDEYSTTTANPNGSLTVNRYVDAQRVKQNGAWAPIDPTLIANADGSISTKATLNPLSISGGGTGALATLTNGAASLSYTWPTALPKPTVSGATATYKDVYPGVDLLVTADRTGGIEDTLVVHDATSAANPALAHIHLGAKLTGATVSSNAAGDAKATTSDGTIVFTSGDARMWDSATTAAATTAAPAAKAQVAVAATPAAPSSTPAPSSPEGPGAGAHTAAISSTLTAAGADITPDPATLAGAGVVYPVYIDPATLNSPTSPQHFNQLTQADPGNANTFDRAQPSGEGIGYQGGYFGGSSGSGSYASGDQCPCGVDRTDLQIGIPTNIFGSQIISASFHGGARFESDAAAHTTPVSLYSVGPLSPGQTWNNPPVRDSQANPNYPSPVATTSFSTPANKNYPGQAFSLDVTAAMQQVANRSWNSWTIELTGDESNAYNFFRIDQTSASFSITYDNYPLADTLNTSPAATSNGTSVGCPSTITGGWLGATVGPVNFNTTVHSTTSSGLLGANFWLYDHTADTWVWNKKPVGGGNAKDTVITASAAPTDLIDGHGYSWTADAYDHYLEQPNQTGPCYFTVDRTPPDAPSISSAQYPAGGTGLRVHTPGTFSLTSNDQGINASGLWCFKYVFDGTASTPPASDVCDPADPQTVMASGNNASLTWAPPTWGTHTLLAWAVDHAGNTSAQASYSFYSIDDPNAKPAPGDITGDGVPDLLTTDAGGDLVVYQADISSAADGSTPSGATVVLRPADSPDGTSWANYHVTHRGSMSGKRTDDLLVQKPGSTTLYIYINDGAGHFSKAGSRQMLNLGASFANAVQIVALGDSNGRTIGGFNNFTDFVTITPDANGINQEWLYTYANNIRFATPVQISANTATSNPLANVTASNPAVFSPGDATADGAPDLWYEDSSGQIWQQASIMASGTADYKNGIGGSDQANHPATKVGTPIAAGTYTLVTSTGSISGNGHPDLWGITSAGNVVLLPGSSSGFGTAVTQANVGTTTGPAMALMLGNGPAGPATSGYSGTDVAVTAPDANGHRIITGAYDATGNGNNVTGTGGVWEASTHDGGAAAFDGSTGVLSTSGPVLDTTQSFTISAWANITDTAKHYAVAARNGAHASSAWLGYDPNLNSWAFEMPSNDATSAASYPAAAAPAGTATPGTWAHLVAVYTATSATSGNLTLYVNGVLAGTGSTTTAWNNTTTPFTIGSTPFGDSPMNGSVDDVIAYTRPIAPSEITSLYDTGKSRIPTGYTVSLSGITGGSTASGQVTLSASTSQSGVAKYVTYIVNGPSYTEVFGGAETAGTGTGGQFAGVNLATATLVDGAYTVTPRITLQNGGTQDFPSTSFTISNSPGHSALIKRSDSPEISVYTGNARIVYTDWNDLVAGYGSSPNIITVTDDWYNALPTTPTPGTLLKSAGAPDIGTYAGGALLKFGNWNDLVAGYGSQPPYIIVPTAFWNGLSSAPADGTLIRKAGSVQVWKYEAATNSKYAYQGYDDLSNAYPTGIPPMVIVPTAYLDGLAISTT